METFNNIEMRNLKRIKKWLHDDAYWITPLNTILIVIGISIGFWQREVIDQKADFSLDKQDLILKKDSERMKKEDSIQMHLRTKLDSINSKQ